MKFTVCGLWTANPESQFVYHVHGADKGEAIRNAQDACRDELLEDGSIDPDDNDEEALEPLDVAAVFEGHIEAI
jgi:hypothetical protein